MDALSAIPSNVSPLLRSGLPADPLADVRTVRPLSPAEIGTLDAPRPAGPAGPTGSAGSFESVLGQFVEEVNSKQLASGAAVRGLLSGEDVPLHRVMIAAEEASVSFQLMVEVRNKLLEAYQELMRMQV